MSTMTVQEAIKRQWGNGGRRLLIVTAVTAVVLLGANVILFLTLINPPFNPLSNVVPQKVLTPRVKAGEMLTTQGTKCNRSKETLVVLATSYIAAVNPAGPSQLSTSGQGVREPGCVTREYHRLLPVDIQPGIYRIVGTETVISGDGATATAGWYSEPFTVIP